MKFIIALMMMIPGSVFAKELITLTKYNTVSLRDSVNWNSMSQLQYELLQISSKLDDDEPIYLVLDTPGGSVSAGEAFIETLAGIPQEIHTIVLFAASMGFQMTQATDHRYILESGTLMSHRAKVQIQGQLDGEIETRVKYYKDMVGSMDIRSAKRVGLDLKAYKRKVLNEWWEIGRNAVAAKMADKVVSVTCSKSLSKSVTTKTIKTFFGEKTLEFSNCPLITTPIKTIKRQSKYKYTIPNQKLDNYLRQLYFNKRSFIQNYVDTGMFNR